MLDTLTTQLATLPLDAVAVMIAVPLVRAVTFPFSSTVATASSELCHTMLLSVASNGATVATRVFVSPTAIF